MAGPEQRHVAYEGLVKQRCEGYHRVVRQHQHAKDQR
jgi:hypothetical protein